MLKKGATPAMDAAPCCFIQDSPTLRDLNGLGDLLLRLHLRHGDGQDAVLHLGRDLIFHDIIRQRVVLLVVRVAVIDNVASPVEELTAQIVMMLVLMFVLGLVLDGDGEVALVVDAYTTIFFFDAWSCKFHRVGLLTLLDIDCGCCSVGTFEAPC